MSRYKLTKDKFSHSTAPDIALLRLNSGTPELAFRELRAQAQVEQIRKKWRLFAEPLGVSPKPQQSSE